MGKKRIAHIRVNHVWNMAKPITSSAAIPKIWAINQKNGWIKANHTSAAKTLKTTCTLATCFWVLVPTNQIITDVNDVHICDHNIIIIPIGRGISPVLTEVIVIALVALLDCKIIVSSIPKKINPIEGRCKYADISKTSCKAPILSFIISRPNNNNPNPNKNKAAYLSFLYLEKIKIENHAIVMIGNAITAISSLNHKTAIIQEVIVVQILAPTIAHIALHRVIKFAQTKPNIITVTTVLLCKIAVTKVPEKIPLIGVLVVVRRNLFRAMLQTCLILSEKIWIPNKNKASHPNKSHHENNHCSIESKQ